MKIVIRNKNKKDLFIALFQTLKNCSTLINIKFEKEKLHIQGMDKSHICLFDLRLDCKWFDNYKVNSKSEISFNTNTFYSIISSIKSDSQNLVITMNAEDPDNLHIKFVLKKY